MYCPELDSLNHVIRVNTLDGSFLHFFTGDFGKLSIICKVQHFHHQPFSTSTIRLSSWPTISQPLSITTNYGHHHHFHHHQLLYTLRLQPLTPWLLTMFTNHWLIIMDHCPQGLDLRQAAMPQVTSEPSLRCAQKARLEATRCTTSCSWSCTWQVHGRRPGSMVSCEFVPAAELSPMAWPWLPLVSLLVKIAG